MRRVQTVLYKLQGLRFKNDQRNEFNLQKCIGSCRDMEAGDARVLNLKGKHIFSHLNLKQFKKFWEGVSQISSLEIIQLEETNLHQSTLQKLYILFDSLAKLPHLRCLVLSGNPVGAFNQKHQTVFFSGVAKLKSLEEIDFSRNHLDQLKKGNHPFKLLAGLKKLKFVWLANNDLYKFKPEQWTDLLNDLGELLSLQSISLANNDLGRCKGRQRRAVLKGLSKLNGLESIFLNDNYGNESEIFWDSGQLKSLALIDFLVDLVEPQCLKNLRTIHFENNGFPPYYIVPLSRRLLDNHSIEMISGIDWNVKLKFGSIKTCAEKIQELLADNRRDRLMRECDPFEWKQFLIANGKLKQDPPSLLFWAAAAMEPEKLKETLLLEAPYLREPIEQSFPRACS